MSRAGCSPALAQNGVKLRATEIEADRLGVWLMARAGYDIGKVVPFWQRLARRTGDLLSDGTHPGWRDRLARVADAVAAVRAQQAAHVPLLPPETGASQR